MSERLAFLLLGVLGLAGCGDSAAPTQASADPPLEVAVNPANAPFPQLPESEFPDICTFLPQSTAEEGLGSPAQNLTSDPLACDWFVNDTAEGGSIRGMTLAAVGYEHTQFDAHGVRGPELGARLLELTSYSGLDPVDTDETGAMFVADDGASTNLLVVPRIHLVIDDDPDPRDVVIWAQLDNKNLDRSARLSALLPVARELVGALTVLEGGAAGDASHTAIKQEN